MYTIYLNVTFFTNFICFLLLSNLCIFVKADGNQPSLVSDEQLLQSITIQTYNSLKEAGFRQKTVYKKGQFLNDWGTCTKDTISLQNCIIIPSYQQQDAFLLRYNTKYQQRYSFSEPTLTVLTNEFEPKITQFSSKDNQISFILEYNCVKKPKDSTTTEVFDLSIPILPKYSLKTRFAKNCTTTRNPYVHFGVVRHNKKITLPQQNATVRVPPTDIVSQVFVRLSEPALSMKLGKPKIIIPIDKQRKHPSIAFSVRGWQEGTRVFYGRDATFSILYECYQNDIENGKLVIPIHPWRDFEIDIQKTCGGDIPASLNIGTKRHKHDIVYHGRTLPKYNLTNVIGTTHGLNPVVLSETTHRFRLFFENTNEPYDESLHVGKLHFTVSGGNLSVKVVRGRRFRGFDESNLVGEVEAGEEKEEGLQFHCRGEGKFIVIVSIPILQYRIVEFGLIKKCHAVTGFRKNIWEALWTVGGMEDIGIIFVILLLISYCLYRRKKVENGFEYQRLAPGMM